MRAVVQRVSEARVRVDDEIVGEIEHGLLILLGVTHDDSEQQGKWLAEKIVGLRIFNDDADKMNLSLQDANGSALVVSQFTLYGDCRKGKRPSFVDAARPELAIPLYESFVNAIKSFGVPTATGRFGAMMKVELVNDGPVTLIIDSK